MTLYFGIFSSFLVALAAVFIAVLPRWWQRRAVPEGNADWLRLRQRELTDSALELREEAALRVMEDGLTPAEVESTLPARYAVARPLGGVLALIALVAGLYVNLGSLDDVSISSELAALEGASPDEISALIARIQRRAEQRPDNADYSVLLGEYHLSANEPIKALVYFDRLIAAGAASPDILGKAAQAEFLSADRQLSERARARADQALAIDPMASAALATLGMAAFEAADFAAAVRYWETLRSLEPEGSPGHQMLSQVIDRARSEVQKSGVAPNISVGLKVEVSLADRVTVTEGATAYVFARPEFQQGGMPIAVVRQAVTAWPLTVALEDRHSMAGQKLSSFTAVSVEVQISANGQPGRENSVAWSVVETAPVGASDPIMVVLQPTDQP